MHLGLFQADADDFFGPGGAIGWSGGVRRSGSVLRKLSVTQGNVSVEAKTGGFHVRSLSLSVCSYYRESGERCDQKMNLA